MKKFSDIYLTGKTLGEGSFGSVSKCEHKQTKQVRAVKKVTKSGLTRAEQQQKFVFDIRILQMLDHPNILSL